MLKVKCLLIALVLSGTILSCSQKHKTNDDNYASPPQWEISKILQRPASWLKNFSKPRGLLKLTLTGPVAHRKSEVSGLSWHGQELIILPQYLKSKGQRFKRSVFALRKAEIIESIQDEGLSPLEPEEIEVINSEIIEAQIEGFQGYEAIVFNGDNFYATIESSVEGRMLGFIVMGKWELKNKQKKLILNQHRLVPIPIPSELANMGPEALMVVEGGLLAFYEANGKSVNKGPVAHKFDFELTYLGPIPMPAVEYRITDVSVLGKEAYFWGINYYWPGEKELLRPEPVNDNPDMSIQVERLVAFRYNKKEKIELVNIPPISLELDKSSPRNWEGIAHLDQSGFLLITDMYPDTQLSFLPY